MTLVVDASVAAKWLFEEAGTTEALALLGSSEAFAAPELILAEISNVAWKRCRRGVSPADQASEAATEIEDFFELMTPLRDLASDACAMAIALDHPVYDCFYLALAERDDIQLITADRRFHERVQGTPWQERVRLLGT